MSTSYYFVEPIDVLLVRGNRSFGGAGEHGEAVMPPWPSLFAGAFRSALLGTSAERLATFAAIAGDRGASEEDKQTRLRETLGEALYCVLGTPATPGVFRVSWVSLARDASPVVPFPADLLAFDGPGVPTLIPLHPDVVPQCGTNELPLRAFPRIAKQIKPQGGCWLAGPGLGAYLQGEVPSSTLQTGDLFARETRLGIALDVAARTAESGALYTTEAVSMCGKTGFLIGLDGVDQLLPETGLLRLGGDGKGATYRRVDFTPPSVQPAGNRFRIVLSTPAIFAQGWIPDGVGKRDDGSYWLAGDGFSACLVCAAVGRHDVISGWDLATWQPKTAQRVAPAGSVYWFDELNGDAHKLASWVAGGLWGDNPDRQRRAEGFNLAWLGEWK